MTLPSEQQLASELGVGQGTVRKALDALAMENLLVRRQGKGTIVAFPEESRLHYQFYRMRPDNGAYTPPENSVRAVRKSPANALAQEKLRLNKMDQVWEIERTKRLGAVVISVDRIFISVTKFPKIDDVSDNLYVMYATCFGQIVASAVDRIKSANASREDSELLGCRRGAAILIIDRVAIGLDGAPIEWRLTSCLTDSAHYLSELR